PLTFERSAREPFRDALEQYALVRDVLIDDRDPFIVDGNDERVSELAERRHRSNRRRLVRPAEAGLYVRLDRHATIRIGRLGARGFVALRIVGAGFSRPYRPSTRERRRVGVGQRNRRGT